MITMCRAGAGSGKTYRITEELVRRLADGTTRPERILATTFTRKAAAELKDRIRSRLLHPEPGDGAVVALGLSQRLDLVARLDDALIGTVHGIGHRLLSRYALRLGLSPRLDPIEDKAEERHLRRILEEMPPETLAELDRLAGRLGVDDPQQLARKLLDEKRTNGVGDDDFRQGMADGTERQITVISGGAAPDLPGFDDFYAQCADALAILQQNGDETKGSTASRDKLAAIVRSKANTWADWGAVAKLKWTKKSEGDAAALIATARRANVHPELHEDLRHFTAALCDVVLELKRRYGRYKAAHGLVDYADQEEHFLRLLEDDDVRADLASGLDLVIVDEFQDTNPIQLAIFRRLAAVAESLWVGDEKQAIYGFRGSAPELMQGVMGTVDRVEPLGRNWRSKPGIVHLINAVFTPIFGAKTPQEAQSTGPSRIERWKLPGRKETRQAALAGAIGDLREVHAAGDIAVLVRTNKEAKEIAGALQGQGVDALVRTNGLLDTREGAMVLAALGLLADRRDGLAAATLRHLDEGPAWFQDALAAPGDDLGGPILDAVRQLNARTLAPRGVVGAVIQALGLPDRIARWGEPARRLANLDALLELASRYENEAAQEGKAATLTGLVYWLKDLHREQLDELPMPTGVDAVQVMTVHKAKGLEWPAVILVQDSGPRKEHPFGIHAEGGRPDAPLEGRRLRHWTYPFGTTAFGLLAADGSGVQDAARASPEGETFARQKEDEHRRLLYVAFTRAKETLVLAEGSKNSLGLLAELDAVLPPDQEGELTLPGDTTYVVRECEIREPTARPDGGATWLVAATGRRNHPPRYQGPSRAAGIEAEATPQELPGEHPFPALRDVEWQDLGHAVHAYLASLPALENVDHASQQAHAAACLARWGQLGVIEATQVVAAGARLKQWVSAEMPGAAWRVEVPLTAPRPGGGQWDGAADLVLVSADRTLVIDHKSADWSASGWAEKAQLHAGQLAVYVDLLEANGWASTAVIHLPLGGGIVMLRPDPRAPQPPVRTR